jgi:hypothetical protein
MDSRYQRWTSVAGIVLCLSLNAVLCAQNLTGVVIGVVRDSSGLPMSEVAAQVRKIETAEVWQARTGANGTFTIPSLGPGVYDLQLEKTGFRTLRQAGIGLLLDQTIRLELQMEVGSVVESVVVRAEAPMVNTESAVRGEVIENREIIELPLDGRSVGDLAFLAPGVNARAEGGTSSQWATNGARGDNANFVLDGYNNRDQRTGQMSISPSVEAVQEFKMATGNYSAEFGRAGGGVMNIALKSGGNALHGALFEFLRNDALDTRNFFAQDKNKLRRNQFGATVSGPVYLPHVYDGRNRTFFLFSWESSRQVSGQPQLTRVPTAREKAGDFSQSLDANGRPVSLLDPLTARPFPQNQIPATRISPIANKLSAYYPEPNNSGLNNYLAYGNTANNADSLIVKMDRNFSSRDQVSGRFLRKATLVLNPFANETASFSQFTAVKGWTLGLGYSRTVSPRTVVELRASLNRGVLLPRAEDYTRGTYYPGRNFPAEFGISGLTADPEYVDFPRLTLQGLSGLGPSANRHNHMFTTLYQYSGSLTWVTERHLIKAGGEAVLDRQNEDAVLPTVNGSFNFLGRLTSAPFGDFLLGYPESTSRTMTWNRTHITPNSFAGFAQDDIRLSSRVTLNLGLRYELMYPISENRGQWSSFVPGLGKTVIGSDMMKPNLAQDLAAVGLTGLVITAKEAGLPTALTYPRYNNFAPRAGIAWRPFGGSRTVVRAGYGVFYSSFHQVAVRNLLGRNYPFLITQTFSRSAANLNLVALSSPFPESVATVGGVTNVFGFDVRPATPYMQSFNVTFERQITANETIEAGYAGSTGTHLPRTYDVNQAYYFDLSKRSATGAILRPWSAWGVTQYVAFGSASNYHSGVLTFRRRLTRGLFARASYVFSKSIDDSSQLNSAGTGGYPLAQDSRNLRLERGRSDFNNRHSFSSSLIYHSTARHLALRGWQVGSVIRANSGQPFTVRVGTVNLNLGEANRPNRIAFGTLPNPGPDAWFDRSAFPTVPRTTFRPGNSGRNILDGPGLLATNASLVRNFRIGPGERSQLQFRWELFNIPNRANFNLPNNLVDSITGATLTSAKDSRVMQFGLRYAF